MIAFTISKMKLVNGSNVREHPMARARRAREQREAVARHLQRALALAGWPKLEGPFDVLIIRIGPRKLDRSNLYCAIKHAEDGLCDVLKVNDGDESMWRCDAVQEFSLKDIKGPDRYAVRVEIRLRGERAA